MLYHSSCHWSIPYQQVVTYHLSIPQFFTEFQQILTVLISVMIECLVQCGGLPNTSVGYYRESTVSRVPIIIGVILTLCNCWSHSISKGHYYYNYYHCSHFKFIAVSTARSYHRFHASRDWSKIINQGTFPSSFSFHCSNTLLKIRAVPNKVVFCNSTVLNLDA